MVEFDTIKDELLAVTDSAVKYGRSLDSNAEVEVFAFYNKKMSAEISQGMVKASDGAVAGCAARVAIGRRVGFASASGITEDRLKLAVSEAHAIVSSVKVEDERFKGFCDPEGTGREGAFHNEILELGTHDLIR
ncbi:MAG: PmbA/TldA family metallopeptidase, partial [Candidatus Thorarchaeota archaeon]